MNKRIFTLLLCLVVVFAYSVPEIAFAAPKFSDTSGHWSESYVTKAVNKGFVRGYTDGRFKPDGAVTRAEFMTMVNSAFGMNSKKNISFKDVSAGDWFYDAVAIAVAAGYTSGYDDGTAKPNQAISRQEAAVMLSRLIEGSSTASLSAYPDSSQVADWASGAMKKMCGKGYLGAYNDGRLHPGDFLTRGQTAKILCNVIDKEKIGVAKSVTVTFNPVSGKTGISEKIQPTIQFSAAIEAADGSVITDKYLTKNIVFRKNSASGKDVDFTAKINSAKTVITVEPDEKLEDDQKYYIGFGANAFRATDGKAAVEAKNATWTVGDAEDEDGVTFSPKDGATGVSTDPTIKISFKKEIRDYDDDEVTAKYLKKNIEFKKKSSSGDDVDFTAKIDSSAKVITITPDSKLTKDQKYYLGFGSKAFTYKSGKEKIPAKSVTWTVGEADGVSFSPSDGAKDVKKNTSVIISFDKAITDYDGDEVTKKYLINNIDFKKGSSSGSNVAFSATINSTNKKITITPEKELTEGQKYYVGFGDKVFKYKSGSEKISKKSATFTVSAAVPADTASKLTSLAVTGAKSMTPAFSATATSYKVIMPFRSTSATVTAAAPSGATLLIDNEAATSKTVEIDPSKITTVKVKVQEDKKSAREYVLNISVEGKTGVDSLSVSGADNLGDNMYSVDYGTTSVTFTIKADDGSATVKCGKNGAEATGTLTTTVDSLVTGQNKIEYSVSSNLDTQNYSFTVIVARPPDPQPDPQTDPQTDPQQNTNPQTDPQTDPQQNTDPSNTQNP
ncbi:MAG: S-layer homology domain-containing protein [Clostridia bacterium]|nr:S-layer homology domain-containing protein [Clostridia bacterium]